MNATTNVQGQDEAITVLGQLVDAMLSNNPDTVAALYTEDCRLADAYTESNGREAFREAVRYFLDAFRMLDIEVQKVLSQGNELAVKWRWTVCHQGEYLGVEATGRKFSSWNLMWLEIKDGMIDSDLSVWDASELWRLQQLSVEPAMPGSQTVAREGDSA